MRVFLAGLAGGLLMFLWSSIAHLVLPLGETGVSTLPNEVQTIVALQNTMGQHEGLFLFPDTRPGKPMASLKGPVASGLLVYHPAQIIEMRPSNLLIEFWSEVAEAMIAAMLLSFVVIDGYLSRVGIVSLTGLAAAITTNASYWNWYGFPTSYTLAYGFTQFMGFVVAGLAIAAIVPRMK